MNRAGKARTAKEQNTSIWPPLPPDRIDCYSRLWQLELWLRDIVYVELKSRYGGDWENKIDGRPRGPFSADKRLRHMPTRERGPLSYVTFDSLTKTIRKHRRLFATYLPPLSIWNARLEEVRQVRNRVAHFRNGHDTDSARVNQLLVDVDKGVWRFCTSYNDPDPIYPPAREKVARRFIHLDPFPWTLVGDNKLARVGHAPSDMVLSVTIETLRRPWLKSKAVAQIAGKYGYVYDIRIAARQNCAFDYSNFLKSTEHLHHLVCHFLLDAYGGSIRITIPAVHGENVIVSSVAKFVERAECAIERGQAHTGQVNALVKAWPEYVLGPDHPLSFLGPDMPCAMFGFAS
jgi:hypothetical protein